MRTFGSHHPAVLMLYFASVIVTVMFTSNPVISATALCGAALFCLATSGVRGAGRLLKVYLPLLLLFSATNPLFSHNGATTLFYLGNNSITLESLLYGAASGVTIISVMLWCKAYIDTVTSDKFLYLFGKLTPRASLVISTVFRFIPMFLRQSKRVAAAQKTMGLYASEKRFSRVRGAMRVMSAMITWSLENAMDTAASMKARGYGRKGRSGYSLYRFTRGDTVMLALCVGLTAVMLACSVLEKMSYIYYPIVIAPKPSPTLNAFYAAFAVLTLLPYFFELKEKAEWKFCALKI